MSAQADLFGPADAGLRKLQGKGWKPPGKRKMKKNGKDA